MFESISPDVAAVRQGRARFYKALPASLLVHAIAILAVPIGGMWNVTFPTHSPAIVMAYSLVEPTPPPPPPPPPPAPPKASRPAQLPAPTELPPSTVPFAPAIIPDAIPIVTEPVVYGLFDGESGTGVEGGVDGGVPGGMVGGTLSGVPGGEIGGTDGGVVASVDEGRVIVPRDQTLRMHALSKTYPSYPQRALMRRWEDQLVVRYVIGTDGRVKEVTVLDPAERKIFDEAAVNAIRHWRFRPMIKDGRAMEVVHELTVYFRLTV